MLIEKIDELCVKNGTTLTALCKEVTGSSGNLPTWKKDHIRSEWLRKICIKLSVSSDYLLELPNFDAPGEKSLTAEERDALLRFLRLKPDYRIKAQSYMVDLFEAQEKAKTYAERADEWGDDSEGEFEEMFRVGQAK